MTLCDGWSDGNADAKKSFKNLHEDAINDISRSIAS